MLTAAHCFNKKKDPDFYKVVAGLHRVKIASKIDKLKYHKITDVKRRSKSSLIDDIALLTVDPPFNFTTTKIQPILVDFSTKPRPGLYYFQGPVLL